MFIIYSTVPDIDTARKIASQVIENKLAACVNILPNMESVYMWEGHVESSQEMILLCKTDSKHSAQLMRFIAEQHPYDVPAIFSIQATDVENHFLKWIEQSLK